MSEELQASGPLEEEDYEPDLLTLEDESGKEHTFEVLDATDVNEVRYLAVVPYETDPSKKLESDAEMLIMRVGEEGGEEYLDILEDEDELMEIGQVFLNRLSEVYDIDLDELQREMEEG